MAGKRVAQAVPTEVGDLRILLRSPCTDESKELCDTNFPRNVDVGTVRIWIPSWSIENLYACRDNCSQTTRQHSGQKRGTHRQPWL